MQAQSLTPLKSASIDTSKVKSDTTSLKQSLKIQPYKAQIFNFWQDERKVKDSQIVVFEPTVTSANFYKFLTGKDTLVYPCFPSDSSNIQVNNYRNLGNQTNLGEPVSPTLNLNHTVPLLNSMNLAQNAINIGFNPYTSIQSKPEFMQFYRAFAPYTEFNYLQGPGKTLALNALHTQNFSPGWNVTLDYKSAINQGQYVGSLQNNTQRQIKLGSLFKSHNGRLKQIIVFSWNRAVRVENGGLSIDSQFFIKPSQLQKPELRQFGDYQPNLTSAKSSFANSNHLIKTQYQLGSQSPFFITHSIQRETLIYKFQDTKRDSAFYGKQVFHDAQKTDDSSAWLLTNQSLGIEFKKPNAPKQKTIGFEMFMQNGKYQFDQPHFLLQQSVAKIQSAGLRTYFLSKWLNINAQYNISGYAQNSHFYQIQTGPIQKKLKKHSSNLLKQQISNVQCYLDFIDDWHPVSLFQYQFESNHYQYKQQLAFTGNRQATANMQWIGISPSNKINHAIFFRYAIGQWINPTMAIDSAQNTQMKSVNYSKGTLGFQIKTKNINFKQTIIFQLFDESNLNTLFNMALPKYQSTTSLYYSHSALRNAMTLILGFDLQYLSTYQNYSYRPDAVSFIIDTKKAPNLGNYFELDLYAAAKIQTVDIFIKAEHINEFFIFPKFNDHYQYVVGYPIQPYRIRAGLNWKFYN